MKKLAFLGGAIGLGVGALLVGHTSHAADHIDAPGVAGANFPGGTGPGQPMADIADVYAWMTTDHSKVNLAMTISPADDGTRHFSPSLVYVFHVNQVPAFGMTGTETQIRCQFASDTSAQCWVGTPGTTFTVTDYVKGDPSNTTGVQSADRKLTLFAGRRSDPFFFNLQGFRDAVKFVENVAAGLTFDAAGCPQVGAAGGGTLRNCLFQDPNGGATAVANCGPNAATGTAAPPCSTTSRDCFAQLNVIAIVLQVDATLLSSTTNPVIGVWASTHASM